MKSIFQTKEYLAIKAYYGKRTAKRSGIPLINHINESLNLLDYLKASELTKQAFCIHPIFQNDDNLKINYNTIQFDFEPKAIILAMEYRSVANEYLSHREISSIEEIRLSPLEEVNLMLLTDKVQNRKDFELYHKESHPRSKDLEKYFSNWLLRFNISEEKYLVYKEKLT